MRDVNQLLAEATQNFDGIEEEYRHIAWGISLGHLPDLPSEMFDAIQAHMLGQRYDHGAVAVVSLSADLDGIVVQRTHPDGALPQGTVDDLATIEPPTEAEVEALNLALDAIGYQGDRTPRPLRFAYYA